MQQHELIFIDDSGDPGFKLHKGSSRFFVIVCVIFSQDAYAKQANLAISHLKHQLHWPIAREFKYHHTNYQQKLLFFQTTQHCPFSLRITVVDKTKLPATYIAKSDSFYQTVILQTLSRHRRMHHAKIYLDGKTGKNYRNRSTSQLRNALNQDAHRMSSFKFVNSKSNQLIQLADMVAGATRAKYDPTKHLKDDYLSMLESKITDLWHYSTPTKKP